MPELPEVEITCQGIAPHITDQIVRRIDVHNPRLRWPVSKRLSAHLSEQRIESVTRRAKYLLLNTSAGSLIVHLGMSGSLRILTDDTPLQRHDHVDIIFHNRCHLRFRDPRRFGCILWSRRASRHRLLRDLGPEPLEDGFDGDYLFERSRRRPGPVKNLLMNSKIVAGVGNIYANEALHAAGIHPLRAANRISPGRYQRLAHEVKRVLSDAIRAGGTTLQDFRQSDGQPGYFRHSLKIYGREGDACPGCGRSIRRKLVQQRSSFYCPGCQH